MHIFTCRLGHQNPAQSHEPPAPGDQGEPEATSALQPEDLPGTDFDRGWDWPVPDSATGHNREPIDTPKARRLSWPAPSDAPASTDGELGVIIHAPHHQATCWAVRASRDEGPNTLLSDLLDLGPALYRGVYDSVVPICPQRYPGHAMVLAFSSVLAQLGPIGHIPVIVDLSRVGGGYFPTVLPAGMWYTDFEEFIRPLMSVLTLDLRVFIGLKRLPFGPGMQAFMQPGDVFEVLTVDMQRSTPRLFDELFRHDAEWGPVERIPHTVATPAYSVTYAGFRYLLFRRDYPTLSVKDAVCALLRLDQRQVTMHFAGDLQDLDVQGTACAGVIMVVSLPQQPSYTPTRLRRRDTFVLNDLRVLGQKPFPYFTHSLTVHIPSALALAQCSLPDCYNLDVAGGRLDWPDVQVEGSTTLTYAVELQDDSQQSSAPPPDPDSDDEPSVQIFRTQMNPQIFQTPVNLGRQSLGLTAVTGSVVDPLQLPCITCAVLQLHKGSLEGRRLYWLTPCIRCCRAVVSLLSAWSSMAQTVLRLRALRWARNHYARATTRHQISPA